MIPLSQRIHFLYSMPQYSVYLILITSILLVLCGFIGYKKTGHVFSLLAGLTGGALSYISYIGIHKNVDIGMLSASILFSFLTVIFALRLQKTKMFMPTGLMLTITSITAVIVNFSFWSYGYSHILINLFC